MLTKSDDEIRPTDEQLEVLRLRRETDSNLMVNSFAGTGKTSMLRMLEKEIDEPLLCLAFNKKIAEEMQKKFKESTECRTLNSLGHRVWGRASMKDRLTLDTKKNYNIFAEIANAKPTKSQQNQAWDVYADVMEAVGLSKSLGYIPEGAPRHVKGLCDWEEVASRCDQEISELAYQLVNRVLIESIKQAYDGSIDFDDQIYMPALFGGAFPRFPIVMVDERQDLSPCNVQMLRKLKGRLIAVGDRYQSIYGFRGAETDGIPRGVEEFSMLESSLSISFRCPEAIVRNVHWRVPAFRWNEGSEVTGSVRTLDTISSEAFPEGSAIICRNNAPLVRLAFHLLTDGRSVTVAGSDIGAKLVNTMKKFGNLTMDVSMVRDKIDRWEEEKVAKGSKTAADTAEAMRIFCRYGNNLGQIIQAVKDLLEKQGTITLTTGHKAKGLEWDTVFHLDQHLIRDDKSDQEKNLRYVIDTRAKKSLFYINSENIQ